jgi:HD-like signal output (HDOD) protein
MPTQIDISHIQRAAHNSIPLIFRLTSLPPESHALLDRILELYLAELGQEQIQEPLSYCLKELIVNAQKANMKRIYFQEKGLDINAEHDYEAGMKGFLTETAERLEHYVSVLKERNSVISVTFHMARGALTISVRNAAELTAKEQERIFDRIARSRAFHSFFEALAAPIDSTEGAGLGIMILLQFLKRIGLGEESFSIESANGETVASLTIPVSNVHLDQIRVLTEMLVRDIETLPHFPENVLELIELTGDPKATISDIAAHVSTDPTLTADLLKHVNSAYYMLPTRVNNIPQAVKLVGLKGLQSILYSYGSQKVLGDKYAEMRTLWAHSYRTAFYAFQIARSLKRQSEILDDVYVSGILHDLGLIVVLSLHPEMHEKMRRFCTEKNIPPRILERFSFGMNHADIGALIARRWNFPEQLVEGIQYHHEPLFASKQSKDIVYCVYLANAVCDLERQMISFEQIEKPVLGDFGIRLEEQFMKIAESLRSGFQERQTRLRGG